jgi:hypothetical protein
MNEDPGDIELLKRNWLIGVESVPFTESDLELNSIGAGETKL